VRRVLYCGSGWFPVVDAIRARLPDSAALEVWDRRRPLAAVLGEGIEVLLPSNAPVDAEAIAAGRALLLVQQPAVGVDGIDLAAARARGVPVCNAPATNGDAVAQAALLLILALARSLKRAGEAFRRAEIGTPIGVELTGRTLLLVGFGHSGRRLDAAARALGMEVLAARSTTSRAELLSLLGAADVVSIHCPLDARTRGMFDHGAFAAMKPGAFLVNCARGGIVDRGAALEALDSGRLGGLGLDTPFEEPWDPSDPLYARPDVIALPHVAGSTDAAYARIADVVATNVRRCFSGSGEPLLHRLV
jgi:phosphoglycerate dehydrogenase-like enzyme